MSENVVASALPTEPEGAVREFLTFARKLMAGGNSQ